MWTTARITMSFCSLWNAPEPTNGTTTPCGANTTSPAAKYSITSKLAGEGQYRPRYLGIGEEIQLILSLSRQRRSCPKPLSVTIHSQCEPAIPLSQSMTVSLSSQRKRLNRSRVAAWAYNSHGGTTNMQWLSWNSYHITVVCLSEYIALHACAGED